MKFTEMSLTLESVRNFTRSVAVRVSLTEDISVAAFQAQGRAIQLWLQVVILYFGFAPH